LSVIFADSTGWINRLLAPVLQPTPNIVSLATVSNVPLTNRKKGDFIIDD